MPIDLFATGLIAIRLKDEAGQLVKNSKSAAQTQYSR